MSGAANSAQGTTGEFHAVDPIPEEDANANNIGRFSKIGAHSAQALYDIADIFQSGALVMGETTRTFEIARKRPNPCDMPEDCTPKKAIRTSGNARINPNESNEHFPSEIPSANF